MNDFQIGPSEESGPAEEGVEETLRGIGNLQPSEERVASALQRAQDAVLAAAAPANLPTSQTLPKNWGTGFVVALAAAAVIVALAFGIGQLIPEGNSPSNQDGSIADADPHETEPKNDDPNKDEQPRDSTPQDSETNRALAGNPDGNENLPENTQQWGNLAATFYFGGVPPAINELVASSDKQFCGMFVLRDESLVIQASDRALRNVVMYLDEKDAESLPIHDDYQASGNDSVVLDNSQCRFKPHISLLRTSQTLVISNGDDVGHNAKIDSFANRVLNTVVPAGSRYSAKFDKREPFPTLVSCSIHPWSRGWLIVKDHPYMAVSDANGHLQIPKLPAGRWKFRVWHERGGYVNSVQVKNSPTYWKSGVVHLDIQPGDNDLGPIVVSPNNFEAT